MPGVPAHSIGARLRAGRERKGLTVLQAAERLHLDPQVVQHLESENFELLGAPVYVRGHIRRFAELVGEHPTELQNLYRTITPAVEPDLRSAHKATATDDTSRLLAPVLYGLGAFAVIGGLWWVVSLSGTATPTTVDINGRRHAVAAAARHPKSAPPKSSAVAGDSAAAPASTAVASVAPPQPPQAVAAANLNAPASLAASSSSSMSGPLREADAGALAAGQSASSSASASSSSSAPPDTQLTLRFNSDSWTEVYDATGKQVFADVGSQGSVRTFKIKPPVKINLGNGPGVGVEVNGRRAPIDNTVRGDGSAQFTVFKDGRVVKH